jgi:hypothetical protein
LGKIAVSGLVTGADVVLGEIKEDRIDLVGGSKLIDDDPPNPLPMKLIPLIPVFSLAAYWR